MKKQGSLRESNRQDAIQAMVMIAPMMLGFFLFTYVPIIYILRYSVDLRSDGVATNQHELIVQIKGEDL